MDNQKSLTKKICIVTTVSITLKSFVVETAKYLYDKCGYDITLICNPDDKFAASLPDYIHYIPVKMARGIDFSALSSIKELKKIFKREKFDMVQYSTPNASCYSSIAAKSAKIPVRLYCQWGIRYTGLSGISRTVFKTIEKMVCRKSTHIRSVSPLNMAFGIDEKLYKADKVKVIGNGGTIGVDTKAYNIDEKNNWKNETREKYGIEQDNFVFGFAGRVSADKGCAELLTSFRSLAENNEKARLLIVGPMEDNCGISEELLNYAKGSPKVVCTGIVDNSEMKKYYSAMDVLVHPTYREGFGMVIQEAGALAVPVITTKIIGASEVMVDGESCVLVEPKNSDELLEAMNKVLLETEFTEALGSAAFERTKELYDRPIMLENQKLSYEELLED